ncbi:MAG: hypothetical protein V3S46_01585 [Nitrospinota bacterium]
MNKDKVKAAFFVVLLAVMLVSQMNNAHATFGFGNSAKTAAVGKTNIETIPVTAYAVHLAGDIVCNPDLFRQKEECPYHDGQCACPEGVTAITCDIDPDACYMQSAERSPAGKAASANFSMPDLINSDSDVPILFEDAKVLTFTFIKKISLNEKPVPRPPTA